MDETVRRGLDVRTRHDDAYKLEYIQSEVHDQL